MPLLRAAHQGGLPTGTMIFLSWLAEGMTLRTAAKMGEDPDAQ